MFFKKKNLLECGIFCGFTDYHSHLLYGVDDGMVRKGESLEVLSRMESLGVNTIWLTPHIMEDMPNTTQDLWKRYEELRQDYSGKIHLNLAAEYMLDSLFRERLEKGDLLAVGDHSLLVETSFFNPPSGLEDIFRRIRAKGYFPLLAHPERYLYMREKEYIWLKESGVRFQLNLLSLTGMYGRDTEKKVRLLLERGWYDCAGTDLHSLASFNEAISRKVVVSGVYQKVLQITQAD